MELEKNFNILNTFIKSNNISQIKVSQELSYLTEKITERFQINSYVSDKEPTLFVGLKSPLNDIAEIVNHRGKAYILADNESFHLLKIFIVKMINQQINYIEKPLQKEKTII